MGIAKYLEEKRLIIDGAMGTYYAGITDNENTVSEYGNITSPELIKKIHIDYINAGARLIRTNTFAANKAVLGVSKEEQKQLIEKAYEIAAEAVKDVSDKLQEEVFIAADIGPIPENSISDEDEIMSEYKEICEIFLKNGANIFLFETFSDLRYIKELVKYIKSRSEAFIITNFCLNKNGYTRTGISAKRLLEEINDIEEIDACGFNCGIGSGHMYQILEKLSLPENKFISAVPNAGYPEQLQNRMVFMDNAGYFGDNMADIASLGADIIGGCCGTTPEYISAVSDKTKDISKQRNVRICIQETDNLNSKIKGNDFYELLSRGKKVIAVELDPPFDAGYEKIIECAHALKQGITDIITIADSPMGRSRVDSILMSIKIAKEVEIPVMPHVCCRDKNMIAMRSSLLGAYINDIRNLLVVTGDPVPSVSRLSTTGVFDYNSIQLMNYIKQMNEEHFEEEPVYYGGALNYGRGRIEKVVERMNRKMEAGAKYFLTQPIYSDDDIERIKYIKKNTDTKILCGIMPLVSYRNANFIKNEIMGINVPDEIIDRYRSDMSKEEGEIIGAEIANEIIEKLSPFADGYYFMLPFNRVSIMDKIKIN